MLNIQPKQWFTIVSGFVSSMITGAALLNPLFGETRALKIVAALGIVNLLLNSIQTAFTGQSALVKDVLAMDGVERIRVNEKANPTLAAVALDPTQPKISPLPEAQEKVMQTLEGASK